MLSGTARNKRNSGRPRRASRPERGFTLIELLVALVLLDIGLLALVGTASVVTRRGTADHVATHALELALSRLERAASLSCHSSNSGTVQLNSGVSELWTETLGANGTRTLEDSVSFPAPRGSRAVVLRVGARC